MKSSSLFAALLVAGVAAVVISGCGITSGPAPIGLSNPPPQPPPTPAARWLYVDHYGTLYEYALPLSKGSKPKRVLQEWPGLAVPPVIAVDPYGVVALGSPR